MMTNIYIFLSYLAQFYLEWKIFQTKVVKEFNINFMFNDFFSPPKIVPFMT